jgi:hypothetical protein
MAKYTADTITIASIWPGTLEPKIMYHGADPDPKSPRATRYWIEPVKRNSRPPYRLLLVSDSFENIADYTNAEGGKPEFISRPVMCEHIVENLLRYWAGNMVGVPAGAAPGIIALKGEAGKDGYAIPHSTELDTMFRMQTMFAEDQFQKGERLAAEREWKGITQTMRDMARWLGRDRPWSTPELTMKVIDCPACRQPIPDDAYICHHCGTRVKALPDDLARLNATEIAPRRGPVPPTVAVPPASASPSAGA